MPPFDSLTEIARPIHVLGVATDADYEALQKANLKRQKVARPANNLPEEPWDAADGAPAYIAGGKWIVTCSCGDAPVASPEWDIARCLGCGAVYRNIVWPPEREMIERILIARSNSNNRGWRLYETADDLRKENVSHGVRVP